MAVSKRLRHEIFRRDNFTCQSCGAKAPDVKLQPDHVIPTALGGSDDPSNLQTLCGDCNSGKSATPPNASTVAKVADDAARWAKAMEAAAGNMLGERQALVEVHVAFDEKWVSWNEGRDPLPRPHDWQLSVDNLIKAGLPVDELLACVDVAMSKRHVRAGNVFKYMCGVAWRKTRELQQAASRMVQAPAVAPATTPGRDECASFLYELTQMEIEVYCAIARTVKTGLGITVDEEALAGAIAQAEIEEAGRRIDLIKLYLEEYVDDGMRFWREAHRKWIEADPTMKADADEVWDLAANLAVKDEALGQVAWSYFYELPEEDRAQWIEYARKVRPDGASRGDKGLAVEASRFAHDASEGRPLPPGMCRYRPPRGIRICFETSAFLVALADCPVCNGPCHGRHELCAGHLEELLDDSRSDQPLVIADYTPLET